MESGRNKMFVLYERLLDAAVNEKNAIARRDIDEMERCCFLGEALIRELEDMLHGPGKAPALSPGQRAAIEALIREIIDINAGNAAAAGNMRDEVASEISGFQKKKAAFKAYRSCA